MERQYYLELVWPLMELRPQELESAAPLLQECLKSLCLRHHGELLHNELSSLDLRLVIRMPVHIAVSRFVLLLKISSGAALGRKLGRSLRWPKGYQLRSLSRAELEQERALQSAGQQQLFPQELLSASLSVHEKT